MILPHHFDKLNLDGDTIQEALDAKDRLQHSTAMERDALARQLHAMQKEIFKWREAAREQAMQQIRGNP